MNTHLLYANSILLSSHLFMSSIPVYYLLSDSANKPTCTSNDEGASIVCLSNLFCQKSCQPEIPCTFRIIFPEISRGGMPNPSSTPPGLIITKY